MDRSCAGCGVHMPVGERERNRRKWCSERCRVDFWSAKNPEKVQAMVQRAVARKAKRTASRNQSQTCHACASEFASSHKRKYCSDQCRWRVYHIARRARVKGARSGPYSLAEVFGSGECGLCGDSVDLDRAYPDPFSKSLDHIIPLARGGTDTADNVQLAHLICNKRKGAAVA